MTSPVRYTKGVTNVASNAVFGQLGMPDPTKYHVFFDDFNQMDWAKWSTLSSAPADISVAQQDSDDGRVLVTLPATEDTYMAFQGWNGAGGEIFTLESGKKLWFKVKLQGNDVDQTDIIAGLISKSTTEAGVFGAGCADGVVFASDDGDAYIDFYVRSGSATISSSTVISSLTDATDQVLGFYFDGVNTIHYFNGETNAAGTIETTSFPTAELLPVFGIRNGEATANTLNVDFICVIKER
jgi:hypothetical protein